MGELERKLNAFWKDSEDELYTFKVRKVRDIVTIKCFDDLENLEWEIEFEKNHTDMAALITNCVSAMYEKYINPQSKTVKGWKGYINRKVKSLGLAMEKDNQDKVQKLNKDMTEQYKRMMDAKFMVSEYKIFVTMFYIIKEEYEPVKEIV